MKASFQTINLTDLENLFISQVRFIEETLWIIKGMARVKLLILIRPSQKDSLAIIWQKVLRLFISRMVTPTLESYKRTKWKALVFTYTRMDQCIRESLGMMIKMGMESSYTTMEINIEGSGHQVFVMAMVFIHLNLVLSIKVYGKMIYFLSKERSSLPILVIIKEIFSTENIVDWEIHKISKVMHTMANGLIIKSMELGSTKK